MGGTPLPTITALARSGALDRAWALFCDNGYDRIGDDPAPLAVKGRLLKDFGLRAEGTVRTLHLSRAEAAYAAAHSLDPQPWLLINMATLAALQGENDRAYTLAESVLVRLDAGNVAETPWFIAATRAEAHVIRNDIDNAVRALSDGAAADNQNWSDRATTLRQLKLLLAHRGLHTDWLLQFQPPKSVHFAGHLGIGPEGAPAVRLRDDMHALIKDENIGFGYGALAAGADIIIAEALADSGAELHLFLSTSTDDFRKQSVAPLGLGWVRRFDALLDRATSIACATDVKDEHEPLATALASEVAMGAAALNANALESEAIQLLVLDESGGGANTSRQGSLWQRSGRRQIRWQIVRDTALADSDLLPDRIHPTRRLAAMLTIDIGGSDTLAESQWALFASKVLGPLAEIISAFHPMAKTLSGARWELAFDEVETALNAARTVRHAFDAVDTAKAGLPVRFWIKISCHFALVHVLRNTDETVLSLLGPEARLPTSILPYAVTGAITATEPFASALFAGGQKGLRAEFVGDPIVNDQGGPVRLFAIKAA